MATKTEIKQILKELNLTEQDMDNFWNELIPINKLIKNLSEHGQTWRNLNSIVIKRIPTQKEKDLKAIEELKLKEEKELQEKLKKQTEEEYYNNHFEEIMINNIDSGKKLTEKELKTLVWEYQIESDYGENRRWTRTVYTVIQLINRFFMVEWEEGLTESQENEYYNQPYEVEEHLWKGHQ